MWHFMAAIFLRPRANLLIGNKAFSAVLCKLGTVTFDLKAAIQLMRGMVNHTLKSAHFKDLSFSSI